MMEGRQDTFTSIGLLVLRIGTGGLLLAGHGWSKLAHFSERAESFANPIGIGPVPGFVFVVFSEVLCASLVMLGLVTRVAVVPIIGFLMVAGFIHHSLDPWTRRELAFVFLVPFVTLFFTGPGKYSLDERIWPTRAARKKT
ncbi:MAG TPA: DoxX family protein [Candidatus Eisenbacteria bacterium]|nr:DoxX family protein [Candidatus Eisenbacteria bacterium]